MKTRFVFNPRIIRSPWSDFYGREIEDSLDAYPDDYLKEISAQGFNGIWLHVILGETVRSRLFPEAKQQKLAILNRLVEKTGKYGIKVFLYLCEPRGFASDHPFWKQHPELKGQPTKFEHAGELDGVYYALCSSTPAVKEYLEGSTFNLFKTVPGLGGAFCITASEFHTHCYSHFPCRPNDPAHKEHEHWAKRQFSCPRCTERSSIDVVAEIITLMNRGIKSAAPTAELIAWAWSWSIIEPPPQPKLINALPTDVILMSDWERGARKKVCGKLYPLDEYSFSYVGPSPQFKKHLSSARDNKLRMMAKIQIGSTHELASVPYLPVPFLLAEKLHKMRQFGVDGYLGCWIFGGDVSPMSRLAGLMSKRGDLTAAQAVKQLARDEFGSVLSRYVLQAWRKFSKAWREFPFSIPFLYYGPINYATAYPLSLSIKKRPPAPSWCPLPRDRRGRLMLGDNMDHWLEPFDAKTVRLALLTVLKIWNQGLETLEQAKTLDPHNLRLKTEWNLAKHVALSLSSTVNIIDFYTLYRKFKAAEAARDRSKLLKKLKSLFAKELQNALLDHELVSFDPRLGHHAEAHGKLYTVEDIDYKIALLKRLTD